MIIIGKELIQLKSFTINIGRPGLLIGRGGQIIDEITKRLSDWLEKPVKIKINEYNVWS